MELHELLSSYIHKIKIQIRFKDIDKQGHVNNANHITYFETARVEYFKDVFRNKIDWINTGMILASTEITYKRPILLEDDVYCYTKITKFGTKSFEIENVLTIEDQHNKYLCASGKSTLVCINYTNKETIEVPKAWIESVRAFERKPS
ncbi:MAG: acyl-CoA thioesterase [Bacteroidota bacterium]|jgi:acyl-CoA thioester hydrolase|nr:acyl-CoA thioesterase [Bacteroidota bacterium]